MKIIHTADLHLDSKLETSLSKEQAKNRRVELLQNFKRLSDYAFENEVKVILIAGDMFDNKVCTKTTKNAILSVIEDHNDINYYILKGNHDKDNFIDTLEERPENLFTFTDKPVSYREGNVTITGVELNNDNSELIGNALNLNVDEFNIVMLHGQEADTNAKDKAEIIPLRELRNKGIDYLALGHIHAYKEGELDNRGTWCYPGCLEGRGFDECGIHGFVLLNISDRQMTRTFIPFGKRKVYEIETDITGIDNSEDVVKTIKKKITSYNDKLSMAGRDFTVGEPNGNDIVRIILTGEVDIAAERDISYIKSAFAEAFYYFEIKDKTKPHVKPHDYKYDESLRGEFVRTLLSDDSLSDEEKAEIIKCGINVLTGGEV